ncbi:MAG: UDP-N-acetylmuramoyl-L-alanyl-D-glutamate--2,6-diaminopimelate ligase [Bacilli bacterium]|nr:UDP-N-acetylmuramoyl-L-alanyl-D-glutamate--2,6-diaminopimelate ligase [Bacilli bacterium]
MNIKTNSKEVKPGDTFIAIKGLTVDGHKYVNDAIERGAKKVVVEYGEYNIETEHVPDTKQYLIDYLDAKYGAKIKTMKLIGVTGTNGKTTSCYLMYQMFNKMNIPCAYIGTIGFYLDNEVIELDNTTPDIIKLYEMLIKCYETKMKYVVMEVSSHALKQDRIGKLKFDYGIFTNLTPEHLDYHPDLNDYAVSKQKLFTNLNEEGKAIINIDSEYSDMMMVNKHNITYGYKTSNYQILDYKIKDMKTIFHIRYQNKTYEVITTIPGKYNIYNILTMIITLQQEKIKLTDIIKMTPILKAPPGRMDIINYKNNSIIIDYAHTPDAVFNVLNAIKEYADGKIYCLIGCGGNRDKSKRSKMGFYATTISDFAIITSDNPRYEKPEDIINDMLKGVTKDNYKVIIDRKEAIAYGVEQLNNKDILVILGKGHEDYQIIGDQKLHHSDKEYVLKICK